MHNTLYRVRRLSLVPTISTADIFRQPFAGLTTYPLLFSFVACPLQQDSRRFDFICPLVILFFFVNGSCAADLPVHCIIFLLRFIIRRPPRLFYGCLYDIIIFRRHACRTILTRRVLIGCTKIGTSSIRPAVYYINITIILCFRAHTHIHTLCLKPVQYNYIQVGFAEHAHPFYYPTRQLFKICFFEFIINNFKRFFRVS